MTKIPSDTIIRQQIQNEIIQIGIIMERDEVSMNPYEVVIAANNILKLFKSYVLGQKVENNEQARNRKNKVL